MDGTSPIPALHLQQERLKWPSLFVRPRLARFHLSSGGIVLGNPSCEFEPAQHRESDGEGLQQWEKSKGEEITAEGIYASRKTYLKRGN